MYKKNDWYITNHYSLVDKWHKLDSFTCINYQLLQHQLCMLIFLTVLGKPSLSFHIAMTQLKEERGTKSMKEIQSCLPTCIDSCFRVKTAYWNFNIIKDIRLFFKISNFHNIYILYSLVILETGVNFGSCFYFKIIG